MFRTSTNNRAIGSIARGVLAVIFFVIAGWLWFNQQYVVDQIAVWRYEPTGEVTALAERGAMSDRGKFLFYASQPMVEGTQKFNEECDRKEENTAILGCYVGNRIYIYNVTDARLDGIKEVTAAHEMLHAAYQRLGTAERDKLDVLIEAEYVKLVDDERFKERMAFYARTEPGERDNELHSMIATEVANIAPELEEYYKTYFSDRSKIVKLHDNYQSVFTEIQGRGKELYAKLTELGKTIEAKSAEYNSNVSKLNDDIQSFNDRARGNQFSSQAQFSSERAALSRRVDAILALRDSISTSIKQYEDLRTQYNETANQSKQLNDSLDSTLAPAPAI